MQPQEVSTSKRFARDMLNTQDIEGAQPDVYKNQRYLGGREYIDVKDIDGTSPNKLYKFERDFTLNLYTKDINPQKWSSKRVVNPLTPEYEFPSQSGRKMISLGPVEKSQPKPQGGITKQQNYEM